MFNQIQKNPSKDSLVEVELIPNVNSEESFTIGVHFKIKKDWHLYWINPGDAGLPVTFDWILPTGISLDTILYPVPKKKVESEITSFIYEKELFIEAKFSCDPEVDKFSPYITAKAEIKWLVCKEKCLPGKITLSKSFDLNKPQKLSTEEQELFELNADKIPKVDNSLIESVRMKDDSVEIILKSVIPMNFYPDEQGVFLYKTEYDHKTKTLKLPLDTFRVEDPKILSGLLFYTTDYTDSFINCRQINIPINKSKD